MDVTPNKTSRQTRTRNSHSTSGCSPRAPSTHMHRCMQGSALHLVTWLPVRARHIQPHGHTRKEPCTRHMLCFLPGEGQGRGRCQCAPSLKPALALVPSRASVVSPLSRSGPGLGPGLGPHRLGTAAPNTRSPVGDLPVLC